MASSILVFGIFFLGVFSLNYNSFISRFVSPIRAETTKKEVFGFAPHWTLSKLSNVDWRLLTTFAYFSLPVDASGAIDRNTYEWEVFEGERLGKLFNKAKENGVRRVFTLTQMDATSIETFLRSPEAWERLGNASADILVSKNLDGVNIDFEYIPSNDILKENFSQFVEKYSQIVKAKKPDSYITVSVLASSERFNRIYDIGRLAAATDGIFMMAYDFYYPGSEKAGPSAPLYGFNNGRGPFWYDVSTAVEDFLSVAPAEKIIMGVPYYGWNYPAVNPKPKAERTAGLRSFATTQEKVSENQLLSTTPVGGWDDDAKVSWRGYWDEFGWHMVYMEDEKSLSLKYDFIKEKRLAGVGIWALGFDSGEDKLWSTLREKLSTTKISQALVK